MPDGAPTRGERNNNPGNIVRDGDPWRGLADDQSSDERFCVFKLPHWGIRALALILLAYNRRHGLNTVRGLINRWAPPVENQTSAYVADVANRCGVASDSPIKVDDPLMLAKLCTAIVWHENGRCVYTRATIANAVDDALGVDEQPIGEAHA